MRKPLLFVGMAPARFSDPTKPLNSRSGRNLAKIFGYTHVHEFADATNVLERWPGKSQRQKGDKFPMKRARKRAGCVSSLFSKYKAVVVLGRAPADVFGLEFFRWTEVFGAKVSAMPHPSPVNMWFNYRNNKKKLSKFKRRLENILTNP